MDRRVIERTYIYVFMTRASTRIAHKLPLLQLNFHSSFISTAMCAFFYTSLREKGITFLGWNQQQAVN
jgi:hypothetical protein